MAFENDLARRRLDQPVEQSNQRRLAGTREAHDDKNLARLNAEADVVDSDHVAGLLENLVAAKALLDQIGGTLGLRPEDFRQVFNRKNVGPGNRDMFGSRCNVFRFHCARAQHISRRKCQVRVHSVFPTGEFKKSSPRPMKVARQPGEQQTRFVE
ncbi:hypothetical protein J2794_003911 [Paraburkholderia terricola]|nr:hypothetical protein [Paraburkholderia terricola]